MITAVVILVALIAIAAYLTHSLDKNDELPTVTPYTKEELDNIKLAEELYNNDLKPVVKENPKPEVAKELEVTEPEFIAKVVETAKVLPPQATINAEAVVEVKSEKVKETKSEFPIDKPKKKRKIGRAHV
jgi:uncharacterized protein (DUF2267 family)